MTGSSSPSITISGECLGPCTYLILVNDIKIPLWATGFKMLAIMAIARYSVVNIQDGELQPEFGQGWVDYADLHYEPTLVTRYLYRTRRVIHNRAPFTADWPVYENHRSGAYRLLADCDSIIINWKRLRAFDDAALTEIVKKAG